MVLIAGLDHFTIHTNRPDETIAFFADLFGLENRPEDRPDFDAPGAWLWAGDQALLHLIFRDEDQGRPSGSLNHVAFAADDFDGICARLDERHIHYEVTARPEIGLRQFFVIDPNGVRIEVSHREVGTAGTPTIEQ